MRLYQEPLQQFREDVINDRIADKIAKKFEEYYGRSAKSEYRSWDESLRRVKDVLDIANLFDNMIIVVLIRNIVRSRR